MNKEIKYVEQASDLSVVPLSSVKLERNSRGYNWELKIYAEDLNKAIRQMEKLNAKMKSLYGEQTI